MIRRPPRATLPDPLVPHTTRFRSGSERDQGPQGTFTPGEPEPDQDGSDEVEHHHRRVRCGGQVADQVGERLRHREVRLDLWPGGRSEEHTSELQSLMRISYAVFCLQKKNQEHTQKTSTELLT